MKVWKILGEIRSKDKKARREEILKTILKNRGIKTEDQIKEFLQTKISLPALQSLVSKKQLKLACRRIKKAIEREEQIVIFGDYDCDGICGTAILWQTLTTLGAKVHPFIPNRSDGYGLSQKGIERILPFKPSLVITVDNGINAVNSVAYLSSLGIDVVITDHHLLSGPLPSAFAILHSLDLSGAAVAWILAQSLTINHQPSTITLILLLWQQLLTLFP